MWIGTEPDGQRARAVLSEDEQARAARFAFDRHRHRYVAARVALRELLGRYLDQAPSEVGIDYNTHGKPEVPDTALRFNLAHSDDLALIGLTEHDRLGVDVERIRELQDAEALARRVFSSHERDTFDALPEAARVEAFFNGWTRKEAFVKAVGEGLSHPLDVFDVTIRPGERARLLALAGSPERAAAWSLFDVRPMDGWVGAVAVEHPAAELHHAGWLVAPPPPATGSGPASSDGPTVGPQPHPRDGAP